MDFVGIQYTYYPYYASERIKMLLWICNRDLNKWYSNSWCVLTVYTVCVPRIYIPT